MALISLGVLLAVTLGVAYAALRLTPHRPTAGSACYCSICCGVVAEVGGISNFKVSADAG